MSAYFHVTRESDLDAILANGLKPQIGPRSKLGGETSSRVYFFVDMDAVENALMNWLGDCFEEHVALVILDVNLDGLNPEYEEQFEAVVLSAVSPDRIVNVFDECLRAYS